MEPLPGSDHQPRFQDITNAEHLMHKKAHSTVSPIPLINLSTRSLPLTSIPGATTYRFHRYPLRTALNIIGPILVTVFYILILRFYIWEPEQNGIIPVRPVDAKGVFFAWVILSIFALDWAKSGLAGFEAAALMNPKYAPPHGRKLMWHIDRGWGSLSSWWKVFVLASRYLGDKMKPGGRPVEWEGPGLLWFYLAFSSILFYAAVPLAGLTLEPGTALQLGTRPVVVLGTNQSTFDIQPSNNVAELASARWRVGRATDPEGDAILYAPEGMADVSSTYFEDSVQSEYRNRLANSTMEPEIISFFSGPGVSERAHGRTWGLLTNLTCRPAHPYTGLSMLNVSSVNNWTIQAPFLASSNSYDPDFGGTNPVHQDSGSGMGIDYKYIMAGDRDIMMSYAEYANDTNLPLKPGSIELVMWQTMSTSNYNSPYTLDPGLQNLTSHNLVVSSPSTNNKVYHGYGVRCDVNSTVGHTSLSPTENTFSNFIQSAASLSDTKLPGLITDYPGISAIQSLVFTAFTTLYFGYMGAPKCFAQISNNCNGWIGANLATNGVPTFQPIMESPPGSGNYTGGYMQHPAISPERMTLALQKLFGEVAITVMAKGPGNWTSDSASNTTLPLFLHGLDPANDITPGRVPHLVVVILLILWTAVTVLPQLLLPEFVAGRRWGDVLDGFAMFRFGAEFGREVHMLQSTELDHPGTASLRDVPGMIGDLSAGDKAAGFVGLSGLRARVGRLYSYAP